MIDFSLIDMLQQESVSIGQIGVLDIGAMITGSAKKEYSGIQDKGLARVVGFEPVQSECDTLNETYKGSGMQYLPYFVGDGTEQDFYMTNCSMTASLYKPNTPLLSIFQNLAELTTTVSVEKVQTQRLDDIPEIDFPIQYIKMDIQGAELQALEGGERILDDVLVIHTEVEWVPMYEGQPLFAEVELFLRKHGFVVHKMLGFGTRAFKPLFFGGEPYKGIQALWSDVVFVRDFTKFDKMGKEQLLKMAVIAHEVYQSFDFALYALQHYDEGLATKYREKLLAT